MLGAAESPLGDREGGATAIFEKSGPPDSADPADFCNKIDPKLRSRKCLPFGRCPGLSRRSANGSKTTLMTQNGNSSSCVIRFGEVEKIPYMSCL
jgi:hypothetical protein